MNKKFLTAVAALVMSGFLSVYSQADNEARTISTTAPQGEVKHNAYKTTWLKNRFKDTWFITFGSGAQTIWAEDDDKADLQNRITYAPSLVIGKYFSPIWGLRLQLTGGTLHGFNDGNAGTYRKWNNGSKNYEGKGYAGLPGYPNATGPDFHSWDPQWSRMGFTLNDPDRSKRIVTRGGSYFWEPGGQDDALYMQHVRYASANVDFMFDLFTLFGNYNPRRAFELTPFVGLSYSHIFPHLGYDAYDVLGANAGLNARIRLSSKFDFNLEGNLSAYPDDFDGHIGGSRSMDFITQATAGITYKIGKSTWEAAEPMNYAMIEDLNTRINDLRSQLDAPVVKVECPECLPCPEVNSATTTLRDSENIKFLPEPVFFRIDKSVIDAGEWSKIEKAVEYLSKYPTTNVVVTGYADKKTGYPAYNMRLSERRAKAVSKVLIEKYNINPLRVSINWEGDKIQPFEINEWNRVVVFVIEE